MATGGACAECHRNKNKCVYPPGPITSGGNDSSSPPPPPPSSPLARQCERCIRLGMKCAPHVSHQGKRKDVLRGNGGVKKKECSPSMNRIETAISIPGGRTTKARRGDSGAAGGRPNADKENHVASSASAGAVPAALLLLAGRCHGEVATGTSGYGANFGRRRSENFPPLEEEGGVANDAALGVRRDRHSSTSRHRRDVVKFSPEEAIGNDFVRGARAAASASVGLSASDAVGRWDSAGGNDHDAGWCDIEGSRAINGEATENSLVCLKNHYGLQLLIREWISISVIRRSFQLLGKASVLAHKCGIHMDQILCGTSEEDGRGEDRGGTSDSVFSGYRMSHLLSTLLEPRSVQKIPFTERRMLMPRLPPEFLSAVGCQSCPDFRDVRNRWIFIRETRIGLCRFYCSPPFERNVLCWPVMSQIYEDNSADLLSLIFPPPDFRRVLACLAHQTSMHSSEGIPPRATYAPRVTVRLIGKRWVPCADPTDHAGLSERTKEIILRSESESTTLEMDCLVCMMPLRGKVTYYLELFHRGNSKNGVSCDGDREGHAPACSSNIGDAQCFCEIAHGSAPSEAVLTPMSPPLVRDGNLDPPMFDGFFNNEDLDGIDDVLASGDIDDLISALAN